LDERAAFDDRRQHEDITGTHQTQHSGMRPWRLVDKAGEFISVEAHR
jgi:hypothetical protein